ncbi:PPOX class F420-dependent oxidoreductase [Candidatus Nitrosotenuis chungbukensis]|uniref:PPOX class F420-dependent oxidoreductase n=1 Tax=Candidatus Nitrosotenuis chungbukensis TaxID=1353246 RepID=UPI0026715250|nr:PPOX class F420-dependent oxidoreductase [Candidatus Nitrosotenuis chungbukensis]WKT57944.1 PPOX class F420-dependent oxidoreductase [Candidatus Nitrosotenuis chungbukensis]
MSDSLLDQKYINLETYRKSGKPVCTPVWFVTDNNTIYVITTKETGKVKRLQNNKNVRIAPCGFRGEPRGNGSWGLRGLQKRTKPKRR